MVGSIDPRCETVRGIHWSKQGRVVVWSSRRGKPSWPAVLRPHQQAGHMDASDPIRPEKTLVARGPSTYGFRAHRYAMPRNDERKDQRSSKPIGCPVCPTGKSPAQLARCAIGLPAPANPCAIAAETKCAKKLILQGGSNGSTYPARLREIFRFRFFRNRCLLMPSRLT
jgi:hypothetical protein